MKFHLNGKEKPLDKDINLLQLLNELEIQPEHVVVELNRDIITRNKLSQTILAEGDQLELIHFVGGG